MPQETQAILCPYCGHTQRKLDRCDACGGSFDPISKRGVAVNMGPWFLHDQRVPFRPGFNYTSMKRLISAGKVTATSIIRGPSTQQLWAPAKLTPGLAHLVGSCPRCETQVDPAATRCPQCDQVFTAEPAYNELGLPFKTGAESRAAQVELDQEVLRTNGRSRSLKLWHHPDVPMLALCPYCGEWQKNVDDCSTCGGVFDQLSQRATVIAMGPWFVRNKRFPYLPGCSYDVMKRQIEAKRIDGSTILRGPTTRQFWSVARNVPGISHLVGHCWSCGEAAKPTDPRCGACNAAFGGVEAQNALGLSFASEAEAIAAEQALEEQFNPMMPPTPVAPPPVPVKMNKSTMALPTGINSMMHAAVGESAFSGLDRASLAVIAAVVIEPDKQSQTEVDDAPADDAPRHVAAARPRQQRKKKSNPALVAVLALLLLTGAIAGIIMLIGNGNKTDAPNTAGNPDGNQDGKQSPPVTTNNNPPKTPVTSTTPPTTPTTLTDAAALKDKATTGYASVRDLSRDGQVGLTLDNIGDLIARADGIFTDGDQAKAGELYTQAIKDIEQLQANVILRDEAAAAKNAAVNQLITIDPTDLPDVGIMLIEKAKMRFDEAQINYDNGEFMQAKALWVRVEDELTRLPDRSKGMKRVQVAEAKYRAAVDRDLDDAMLKLAGGEPWVQVALLVTKARTAANNEQWDESVDAYEKAAQLAPAVMTVAKPLAVRYWTCLAGQTAARAWHDHIDGATLDPRLRGVLRPLLLRLHVPFAMIDQAMLAPVTKDEAMKLLLSDPAAAMQKNHGDYAINSFQLGVHLVSLSRLLTTEDGKMPQARQTEITSRLAELQQTVKIAGFNQKMTDLFDAFAKDTVNLSEPTRITNAKKLCDNLIATLASAEQAIDMWK